MTEIDEQIAECKEKLQHIHDSIEKDGYNYYFDNNSIKIYEEKLAVLERQRNKK